MWSTANWRTAIPAEPGEQEAAERALASPARAIASIAVIGVALALAVLPALVALGPGRGLAGVVAVGAGALAVVAVGGVKLAALAADAARFAAGWRLLHAPPSVD